jgi:hypothetical protein
MIQAAQIAALQATRNAWRLHQALTPNVAARPFATTLAKVQPVVATREFCPANVSSTLPQKTILNGLHPRFGARRARVTCRRATDGSLGPAMKTLRLGKLNVFPEQCRPALDRRSPEPGDCVSRPWHAVPARTAWPRFRPLARPKPMASAS